MEFQNHKYLNKEHYNSLYYAANFLVRDKDAANDIVIGAMVKAYSSDVEFNSKEHFHNYLFQNIRWSALNFFKKQKTISKVPIIHDYKDDICFEEAIDNKIIERETIGQLHSAIEILPDKTKSIARMLFFEDLSVKKVAALLNISENNVRSHKNKAVNLIRDRIHKPINNEVNKQGALKATPSKLCLRVRNGKIEVIMEQPDGNWVLSDGTTELASGLYVYQQSTWTVVLRELEKLINNSGIKEQDLQDFFEAHPQLILGDEYDYVIPQAAIVKDDRITWRADFVLVPSNQLSFSKILELKLPSEKISLTTKNGHSDYSKNLLKAINQLRDYHQAFDSDSTTQRFKDRYRTDVFKPVTELVFGRRNSINNNKDFLELQHRNNVIITDWDSLYEKLKKKYS